MEVIMRKELENRLYEVAPIFYSERDLDAQETCLCLGFECGDGWFEPLLDFSKEVARINEIAMKSHICFVASQFKEKYGEIRVYWHTKSFPDICDLIPEREDAMRLYPMMNNASIHWWSVVGILARIAARHITSSPLTDGFNISVSNVQSSIIEIFLHRIKHGMEE